MKTLELLATLLELQVKLWLEDGRLKFSAPEGVMTPALKTKIVEAKAEIVEFLQQSAATEKNVSSSFQLGERPARLPLSFPQQRLWFIDQLEPGNPAYHLFFAVDLRGDLQVADLERAFRAVVQRHESLRTGFYEMEGQPFQRVFDSLDIFVKKVDLTNSSPSEQACLIETMAKEESSRPFDLANPPLVRCQLTKLAAERSVLFLTMHHIVSDGWSMGVLFREMILLAQGRSLPPLALQYPDFALWQKKELTGTALDGHLLYWKDRLANVPQTLELPLDFSRPLIQTSKGSRRYWSLSRETSLALSKLALDHDASLFMLLLAGFSVLLYRYTMQTEILIGTPIANRKRHEQESMIGFFVNTLVLRADLSGAPSFIEFVARIRETCLGAYEHQDLPFELLLDELHVKRDLSRNPLFQVMFAFQNTPSDLPPIPGLTAEVLPIAIPGSQFDLSLSLNDSPLGIGGFFEYNTDLFLPETIDRMVGHFQELLAAIVENSDEKISHLHLLSRREERQILLDWNRTDLEAPPGKRLHQFFEEQARRRPNEPALVFEKEQLTYRDLDERANRLAHFLLLQGIGPEVLVGVCLERSIETIVSLFAILKAGGAYVPLDPAQPKERLAAMLEEAQITKVLSQTSVAEVLPEGNFQVFWIDTISQVDLQSFSSLSPAVTVQGDHLAYILFTSGTTGRPKGVCIEHRNAAALIHWMGATYCPEELSGVLAGTSLGFDLSIFEIFGTLAWGGCVILAQNILELPTLPARDLVTLVNTVPSAAAELLRCGEIPPKVRTINLAGEPLASKLVDELYRTGTVQRVIDAYGPTENTTYSTFTERKPNAPATIGRSLPHWTLYVVDRNFQVVPVGVTGELYIGGAGVARGYVARPELTSERFLKDPFSVDPRARIYKTGDLVRWTPDGNLVYLGRNDHQVKIRGFRIELGEIEAALGHLSGIRQSLVLVREDQPGNKRLVAYLTTVLPFELTTDEIRKCLKSSLPEYMIPSAFVFLESFPVNLNGKVDRSALPIPEFEGKPADLQDDIPRTEVEEQLAKIWSEVLSLSQVGLTDNFFVLGGNSLLAMRVISKARQVGLFFSPRDLFRHQTIRELLQSTNPSEKTVTALGQQGLVTGEVSLIPPLVIIYGERPPQAFWHLVDSFVEIPRSLTPSMLDRIVSFLVAHHDGLRLRLVTASTGFRMFIDPESPHSFVVQDLSGISESEQDDFMESDRVDQWASVNFETGPLFRVVFYELGPERLPRLLLLLHHIAGDAYSVQLLMNDLVQTSLQALDGNSLSLPPKTTSIQQWAQRMERYRESSEGDRELEYWRSRPWKSLLPSPADHPEVTRSSYSHIVRKLSEAETQGLLLGGDARLLELILTACFGTISRQTKLSVLAALILHQNRNSTFEDLDLSRSVGSFYSSYPFLLGLEMGLNSLSNDELLKLVSEEKTLVPNGGATWPWVGLTAPDTEFKQTENFLVNYLGPVESTDNAAGSLFRPVASMGREGGDEIFDIADIVPHACQVWIENRQFCVKWLYFKDVYNRSTIDSLLDEFFSILRSFIA